MNAQAGATQRLRLTYVKAAAALRPICSRAFFNPLSPLTRKMPKLEWSEQLSLQMPEMDRTHVEFVDLLAAVQAADDAALLPHWQALIDHTDDHFGREDGWMTSTGFTSSNCHTTQHKVVLAVMREGAKRGAAGDLAIVRQMADELTVWFPQHAQSMDAALALHLKSVGYDFARGVMTSADALPGMPIEGCHGAEAPCASHAASAV